MSNNSQTPVHPAVANKPRSPTESVMEKLGASSATAFDSASERRAAPLLRKEQFTIGLAPMEGVTGFPARIFFHLASAPSTLATPFLRVTATHPHKALPPEFAPEITALGGRQGYRLIVQLMAVEADDFLRAAELFLPHVDFLELNCGCPSPTCVGKGAGSSMLKEADEFHATMERLSTALGAGRFAIKMRTGFHQHEEFPRLLGGLAELPLARLTVHGRTRPQGYTGRARWDLIAAAAAAAAAPVVASGDVVSQVSLASLRGAAAGASGALVGRGALRNPWIFEELRVGVAAEISYPALRAALVAFALLHELPRGDGGRLFRAIDAGLLGDDRIVNKAPTPATDAPSAGMHVGTADAAQSPKAGCGFETEKWQAAADLLARQVTGDGWPHGHAEREAAFPFERHTVGRLKLLWSYLRSSLPPLFFAAETLRAKTVGEMLARIDTLAALHGLDRPIPLAHCADYDWIYAGSKKS